jgi:hypothetical protein
MTKTDVDAAAQIIGPSTQKTLDAQLRPADTLTKFSVQKYWDADSTPAMAAALSRIVGKFLPASGARTPEIEAGVVLASLMHDVAYYYGGNEVQKAAADALFAQQIPAFVAMLNPKLKDAAERTAAVDRLAVQKFGGEPFDKDYSWNYGLAKGLRGYRLLDEGQAAKIQQVARKELQTLVGDIKSGRLDLSPVLKKKLAQLPADYRAEIITQVRLMAQSLDAEFKKDGGKSIPGFES